MFAAIVAFAMNNHFLDFEPLFSIKPHDISYSLKEYLEVSLAAIIWSAPAGLGIAFIFKRLKSLIKLFPALIRPVIPAAVSPWPRLVLTDPSNDLADNSQYWLAECYYTIKNYKRAVIEFEKVFSFSGTDKDDDAQLKLGHCHRSMGNIKKAKEEYQRLLDYFPGSEFYDKARNSLKQLSSQ